MAVDIVMPQMGESIAEGTIVRWIKKVGDAVERDEPLFEISTDKVDAEIPSPVAGVLTDIKVHEGETVQINLINGEGAEHDIVLDQYAARSSRVQAKGASTSLVFAADMKEWVKDVVVNDPQNFTIELNKPIAMEEKSRFACTRLRATSRSELSTGPAPGSAVPGSSTGVSGFST